MKNEIVMSLNQCIEACVDAQRAYAVACAEARAPGLKETFLHRSEERARFVEDLQESIVKLGAFPENQGTLGGALRRRWMDLEQDLEPVHDDRRVMRDVLREERASLAAYRKALSDALVEAMPLDVRVLLREQTAEMQGDLEELVRQLAA